MPGLTFGWHNHDFEFADLGGEEKPLDLILQGSDDLALELDVAWVQVGGEDPITWIEKYADRIVATHIKDIAPKGEARMRMAGPMSVTVSWIGPR